MKDNKIAFIMCANDQQYVDESLYYINQLDVSEGFELEFYAVTDAASMCEGYEKARQKSDAKYKIYLHQDTFLLEPKFLQKMILAFLSNKNLGLLGVIGTTVIPENGYFLNTWNTGAIYDNLLPSGLIFPVQEKETLYTPVKALDGLILMTQYDIPWREDLFDGWDFYDISYAMEMQKMGYEVGVLNQETPYCYHCNHYSKITNYYKYQDIFCNTYLSRESSVIDTTESIADMTENMADTLEQRKDKPEHNISITSQKRKEALYYRTLQIEKEQLGERLRQDFYNQVNQGNMKQVFEILKQEKNLAGFACLSDFHLLQAIDELELQSLGSSHFILDKKSFYEMKQDLNAVLFDLKRIEYKTASEAEAIARLKEKYSSLAVLVIIHSYVEEKEEVKRKLGYFNDGYQWKV